MDIQSVFGQQDPIQTYRSSFSSTWEDEADIRAVRFVVLDTETTGLDPRKDVIVSLGAVAVVDGQIELEDQFEVVMPFAYNTSAVMIHGVTREGAQRAGVEEGEAMKRFLGYLRDGVIVGHHIGFDIDMLKLACERRFRIELNNRWLDTMELTLHLEDAGAFPPLADDEKADFSLDGLCRKFNIAPHDRHTAGGDAFITAQIFLKLLRLAQRHGRSTLNKLCERYEVES